MAHFHFHRTRRFFHSHPSLHTKPNWKPQLKNGANSNIKEIHPQETLDNLHHNPVVTPLDDPDVYYAALLQTCTNDRAVVQGKRVHADMLLNGLDQNIFLATKLAMMYFICHSTVDARKVFDKLSKRNLKLWNVMIKGYADNGHYKEALELYYQMQQEGMQSDNFTFPFVLKACAGLSALQEGREIHYHVMKNGFESDVFVGTALIDMYAKCKSTEDARQVFDKMSERDVVSWNAMIAGYAQNGQDSEALALFRQMQMSGVKLNSVTIVSVLPACTHLAALQQVKSIHDYIIRTGIEVDAFVGSALISMYAKCGSLKIAHVVFEGVSQRALVLWNSLIGGYVQNGHVDESLNLFRQMQLQGLKPDPCTVVSFLPVCASLEILYHGKEVHNYIVKNGFESNVFVTNALIDMYCKCSNIETARHLFDRMPKRDLVSWNAMIAGYVQNGYLNEALVHFHEMRLSTVNPDSVTLVSVLPACAHLTALQQGMRIHHYAIQSGLDPDVSVQTALMTMYAKCGNLQIARQLFDNMPTRDVVSWNAMIAAYGMHGHGNDALVLFSEMQRTGLKPNHITFVGILSSCSHAGLVDEGWKYFNCMSRDYCITPSLEHYACMVDLIGRAGHVDEAWHFIENIPLEPDAVVWGALLGACRIHSNIELAECVAERLLEMEPKNDGNYVLLSNIYAASGRWDDVAKVRAMLKDSGLKKNPGCSWIEVKNIVHTFLVGDRSHPQSNEIYAMLENIAGQMKVTGYVPDTDFVLRDVEEEEKESMLGYHSEKLAIAFGLINTIPGTPIRITKNLRVCGDCHSAINFISKIFKREIIVRDANRFHNFKDGVCSCGNYW